jgi:hypothetical protein
LNAEHDNLRAALASGLAEDPAAALRLAVSLWRFWLARGDFSEASRWLAATLAAAPEPTASRARALLAASAIEVRRGDPSARQIDSAPRRWRSCELSVMTAPSHRLST